MRRLVTTALAFALLAVPASAMAANVANVDINNDPPVYTPAKVTISPGDSVIWTHQNDPLLGNMRGVRFEDEDATTQTCPPAGPTGSTCTRTFDTPGRYAYYDPATCSAPPASACAVNGQVVVYVPPTAAFSISPNPQLRGQPVSFNSAGSGSPGGSITSYSWDFGDGTTASGASESSTSHIYGSAGTFTVRLTVTDDQGNASPVKEQLVTITVPDSDSDGVNDDGDMCPTTPAATPDGCPLPPPPLPPPPIDVSATAADTLSLAGALKSGVTVALTCSAVCNGVLQLSSDGGVVSLPATLALPAAGTKVATLPFTSDAVLAMSRLKSTRVFLEAVVTDALGRTQTVKAGIVLTTVKTLGKLPAIGISDNQPATFEDKNFQILKLRYARLVTPWDSIFTEPDRLDAWLQAARAHGIRPLVSFEHTRGQICPASNCNGPTKAKYTSAWKAFHKKYPWVKDISPWNEVNSATQPTGKHPELAATYYNVVRASCHGCSIVAADLLDAPNIKKYATAFLKKAKGKPKLWGLHNYTDTNRFRSKGTTALLATVKGTIWLTETGGVVKFVTQKGVVALPESEARAKKAMDYMFRLAEKNAKRIKRIYVYQWKVNNKFDRFDAGVVRSDGTPRPSFQVLSLNASIAAKR